jgi:hypothetical protein
VDQFLVTLEMELRRVVFRTRRRREGFLVGGNRGSATGAGAALGETGP